MARTLATSPRALPGVLGRMERLMAVSIARETQRLEWGLTALGIMASAAPLLGLAAALWALMAGFAAAEGFAAEGFAALASTAAQGLLAGAAGLFVAAVSLTSHHLLTARCAAPRAAHEGFCARVFRHRVPPD